MGDLADGVLSLDCDLTDLEARTGPTRARVDDDIVFSFCVSATHQADHSREEGKRLLAICIKEAFCGQALAQALYLSQQVTQTLKMNFGCLEVEASAALPKNGLDAGNDFHALLKTGTNRSDDIGEGRHGHGRVRFRVAQCKESHARTRARVVLNDLAFNPERRHAIHVDLDVLGKPAERPRVVTRGIGGFCSRRHLFWHETSMTQAPSICVQCEEHQWFRLRGY